MKICRRCKIPKEQTEFHKCKVLADGLANNCKKCSNELHAIWYQNNKAHCLKKSTQWQLANKARHSQYVSNWKINNPDKIREYVVKDHGINLEQYNNILQAQNGVCAICKGKQTNDKRILNFHIDHDHNCCAGRKSCGKCIRGLLCNKCNSLLGFSDDSKVILNNAITYLAVFSDKQKESQCVSV